METSGEKTQTVYKIQRMELIKSGMAGRERNKMKEHERRMNEKKRK